MRLTCELTDLCRAGPSWREGRLANGEHEALLARLPAGSFHVPRAIRLGRNPRRLTPSRPNDPGSAEMRCLPRTRRRLRLLKEFAAAHVTIATRCELVGSPTVRVNAQGQSHL